MRSIFDFKPQFKRINLDPFNGDFNVNVTDGDVKNAPNYLTLGIAGGGVATALGFDIMDPFGTKAAMRQQQNLINEYRNQQDQLMRDEQNRRWQNELSNSWAAYGNQRRSQIVSGVNGAAGTLGPMGANDLYLGGR